MTCSEAAPFVSRLHDGDDVPVDALSHITGCAFCRARLREWSEAAANLRLIAAADRLAPLPALVLPAPDRTVAPGRTAILWRAWTAPVRMPRVAAALAAL